MKKECHLCKAVGLKKLFVDENKYAIAFLPVAPLREGHILVLPRRHISYEKLTKEEHQSVAELVSVLKDELKNIFPNEPPLVVTLTDTIHSSIRNHFHFHLVPSRYNLRKLIAKAAPNIKENERIGLRELEEMTEKIKSKLGYPKLDSHL